MKRHDFKRIIADIEASGTSLYQIAVLMDRQYIQVQRIKKTGRCQHWEGERLIEIHREAMENPAAPPSPPSHYASMTEFRRAKSNARSYANVYQRRGALEVLPCQKCGADNAEKHHEDYSKPLEVVWLCRRCHMALHREAGVA